MTDAEQYMRRAIKLAEKGRHRVMPNPLVGCVLVKDGEIVAEMARSPGAVCMLNKWR